MNPLRTLRERAGIATQAEAAKRYGVALKTWWRWEQAETPPTLAVRALEAEAEVLKLRKWNQQMVEMAAQTGNLDGYREMGAKLAAAEAEIERLRATVPQRPPG